MKKTVSLFVLLMLSISILSAQKPVTGKNPSGKWKFEAPYAPEGYTSGIIELTLADNAYSNSISFTGNDYKIPADKTKVEQDSISFSINVEGNDVSVSLKIEEANKMSGKALYAGGEIPLILTRETMEK
jgi:hypothetical protein